MRRTLSGQSELVWLRFADVEQVRQVQEVRDLRTQRKEGRDGEKH
jgi:hypothetical protein